MVSVRPATSARLLLAGFGIVGIGVLVALATDEAPDPAYTGEARLRPGRLRAAAAACARTGPEAGADHPPAAPAVDLRHLCRRRPMSDLQHQRIAEFCQELRLSAGPHRYSRRRRSSCAQLV